jgi:putative restriction endonuclease
MYKQINCYEWWKTMNSFELKDRINNLSILKKKGDLRAPYKPLLIKFALGQLQANKPRFISYEVQGKS